MRRFVQTAVFVMLVLGCVGTYVAQAWRSSHAVTQEDLQGIPERLAGIPLALDQPAFQGSRDVLEQRIVDLSGAQHYAAIDYRGEQRAYVRLHVGVNVHADGWLHEPTVCLPSQGWTNTETRRVPMWAGLSGVEAGERIWRMELAHGREKLLVYYWFQWGRHIVTTRFERAWHRFLGLLAGERDRPIQIVIFYSPIDVDVPQTEARVEGLVRALWPRLFTVLTSGD